jgi:hypothetical protein
MSFVEDAAGSHAMARYWPMIAIAVTLMLVP